MRYEMHHPKDLTYSVGYHTWPRLIVVLWVLLFLVECGSKGSIIDNCSPWNGADRIITVDIFLVRRVVHYPFVLALCMIVKTCLYILYYFVSHGIVFSPYPILASCLAEFLLQLYSSAFKAGAVTSVNILYLAIGHCCGKISIYFEKFTPWYGSPSRTI